MSPWLEKRSVAAPAAKAKAATTRAMNRRTNGARMEFPPLINGLSYGSKSFEDPMTQEIFREEPYRTEVEATVESCDAGGIVLDRTIFYPKGGGQAGDAGVIVRPVGSTITIIDTVKPPSPLGAGRGEGHSILHVPAPDQDAALAPGEKVPARPTK